MRPTAKEPFDVTALTGLLERCRDLCDEGERVVERLAGERGSFLATNLADALEQLELILRALGAERGGESAGRQGFLKRLFGRGHAPAEADGDSSPFELPQQGLQGNSWTVSLADLTGFLAFGRKTGVLWVDSPQENFLLGMVDGRVTHATSDHTPEGLRLGEILVGFGYLTRRQLERFLEQSSGGETSISGALLVESGMISAQELSTALVHQMQQTFQRLVQTKHAVFRFREGMQVLLSHQVELDVNHLLLESARVADEAAHRAALDEEADEDREALRDGLAAELVETDEGGTSNAARTEAATAPSAAADATKSAEEADAATESAGEGDGSDAPDTPPAEKAERRAARRKREHASKGAVDGAGDGAA